MQYLKNIKMLRFVTSLIIVIINYKIVSTSAIELMGDTIPIPCSYTQNHIVLSCNCNFASQVMEMPPHNGSIPYIQISNCETLVLRPNIFSQISDLNWIRFFNIRNLEMGEKSFYFKLDPVEIKFDNVHIQSVPSYAFLGQIEEIHFNNSTIEEFREYSVSGIGTRMNQIIIKDSNFHVIKPQAFKKFSVENFIIEDTHFHADLPSKAFYHIEISDTLTVQRCLFQSLYPGSIYISKVAKVRIWENSFHVIEPEAFNVTVKSSFEMEHNNFTAVHNAALRNVNAENVLTVWEKIHQPRFVFRNNTIENLDANWMITPSAYFSTKISDIYVVQPKTCDFVHSSIENAFISNISHEIYIRTASDPKTTITLSQYQSEDCQENSYIYYGIIGIVLISTALIIVVILVVIYVHRERQKIIAARTISPEPRTYRETQIVMQVETHNLMKTDF